MLSRREFFQAVAAVAVSPSILAERPWRAFLMDDCDFVAAQSAEEAQEWYFNFCGVEVKEAEPVSLQTTFRTDEDPGAPRMTFAAAIAEELAAGETEPFYLATDGHYC